MSPACEEYLSEALQIIEQNALNSKNIQDWRSFRNEVIQLAGAAQVQSDTYGAIQIALCKLGDGHSRFMTPQEVSAQANPTYVAKFSRPSGQLLDGDIALVVVPTFASANPQSFKTYAETLQAIIENLDHNNSPRGWIVDLSQNNGGTMWPMLCGLGPLLGSRNLGFFVSKDGSKSRWIYRDGGIYQDDKLVTRVDQEYRLRQPDPKIAVITSEETASSGEAVVVAFRGSPNTKSFGQPTYGVSTANNPFHLSDGAVINLTVSVFADRTDRRYGSKIRPDYILTGDYAEWRKQAVNWLKSLER